MVRLANEQVVAVVDSHEIVRGVDERLAASDVALSRGAQGEDACLIAEDGREMGEVAREHPVENGVRVIIVGVSRKRPFGSARLISCFEILGVGRGVVRKRVVAQRE